MDVAKNQIKEIMEKIENNEKIKLKKISNQIIGEKEQI